MNLYRFMQWALILLNAMAAGAATFDALQHTDRAVSAEFLVLAAIAAVNTLFLLYVVLLRAKKKARSKGSNEARRSTT